MTDVAEIARGRQFPVLEDLKRGEAKRYVPWSLLAPHEAQAYRNHSQSLATLASRGGLSWGEMLAVITGQRWSAISRDESANEAAVRAHLTQEQPR